MMGLSLRNFWAIVFVVVALFLLIAVSADEGHESPALSIVDDSTELIADTATDTGAVQSDTRVLERLPESPGGVIAKVTTCDATDNAKAVQFGGAAGLAASGIRGPTTI